MRKILGVKDGLAEQINRLWHEARQLWPASCMVIVVD